MSAPRTRRAFSSRVAARLYLFVLSVSLIPLTLGGLIVYDRFSSEIAAQVTADLRETAKLAGLSVLEAIRIGESELKRIGDALVAGRDVPATRFVAEAFTGDAPSETAARLLQDVAATGLPKLIVHDDAIYLATLVPASGEPIVGVLGRDELLPNVEVLPFGMTVCVETPGLLPSCGRRDSDPPPGDDALSSDWTLFLGSTFQAPDWHFTVAIPEEVALEPLLVYRRFFPLVTLLTGILVTLLLARIVAKILSPVRELTEASHALASGQFDTRVTIDTGDEFQTLGNAYNKMASRLGRQVDALRSLAELDRRMIEGLGLEDICASIIGNLREVPFVEDAGVLVASQRDSDNALLYSYDADGNLESERLRYQTSVLSLRDSQPAEIYAGSRFAAFVEGVGSDDESREIVVVPVVSDGRADAALLIVTTDRDRVVADEDQELVGLSQRLAVALSSLSRDQELHRKAHYDDLTGLPNRQLCMDRLDQEILFALRDDAIGAVLFLDLDRFKQINDLAGHSHGDQVLVESAERLRRLLRSSDSVCRFGGDEFVVLLPRLNRADEAAEVASDIIEALSRPFTIDSVRHFLGVSVGIAVFPNDGKDSETVVKNADAAMYSAKAAGRGQYRYFGAELHERNTERAMLERDLRSALSRPGQLSLVYQPKIQIDDGDFAGAEVLLRWQHPTLGSVPPQQFIAIAEECGLITRLGAWVLQHTLIDYAAWMQAIGPTSGKRPVVSVNVSPRQLIREQFADDCIRMVDLSNVERSSIEFEITETALADNSERATELVSQLRNAGFRISIDDFGTGYSSLSQLTTMPFDAIKIDKSFVLGYQPGNQNDTIVRSVVRLAQELGKEVIAEGVETAEQLAFLTRIDCTYAQGYFYAKPMPLGDLIEFHRTMLAASPQASRATG